MLSNATIIKNDDGSSNVALFLDGEAYLAHSSHANYKQIIDAISAGDTEADYEALFDTGKLIQGQFEAVLAQVADQSLSERISVVGGEVRLDGDPVSGSLEDQILAFVREGADFGPLVRFYEKLVTNPLGNVKQGVFDFAVANGLTITEDGNLLGYKAVQSRPEGGFTPSRVSYNGGDRVNGVEVKAGEYIVQDVGDVVEMPRSKVLNAPSRECGTGLHIGTFQYASTFYGDTILLVEFNPRDIVSLPDRNSSWKLRVCRYTVVGPVTEPLDIPVYMKATEPEADVPAGILQVGLRVVDDEGDEGTVKLDSDDDFVVEYDSDRYGNVPITDALIADGFYTPVESDEDDDEVVEAISEGVTYEQIKQGLRVKLSDGTTGTVEGPYGDGSYNVEVDAQGTAFRPLPSFRRDSIGSDTEEGLSIVAILPDATKARSAASHRAHGKGGKHSKAAEGNGLNPAQDPKSGQFVAGRPGSGRDRRTGRFTS